MWPDVTDTTKYKIDGSWLYNGEYERAFKGYPSKKEVNVFIGAGYGTSSWSSTFMASGIATGVRGLGLWAMSLLFKGKQPQQTTIQGNIQFPTNNSFGGFGFGSFGDTFTLNPAAFNFTKPAAVNTSTNPKDVDTSDPDKVQDPDNKDIEDPDKAKGTTPAKEVKPENKDKKIQSAAVAINDKLRALNIEGKVSEVGKNNKDGYPTSFVVTDLTNGKTEETATIYTFSYVGEDETSKDNPKPMYQLSKIIYSAEEDKTDDIEANAYTVSSGINKGKEGEDGSIGEDIDMYTESNKPAIKNAHELGKGTRREWIRKD